VRDYDAATYGDAMADIYDDWYAELEVDAPVAALAALAGDGPVLELGVGTGRLALPLAATGLSVAGVDASEAMLAALRAKPGGDTVTTVLGDMAGDDPLGPFTLVYAAVNTFFNLVDDGAQQACLAAAARRLVPGGRLVLEAFVPDPDGHGDAVRVRSMSADRVVLAVSVTDVSRQTASGQFVELVDGRPVRLRPWSIKWCTPDQLDAMAAAAGLELEHRWADWTGADFTPDSARHVSVWRRKADVGWAER
jgi:SAM-dependent methyltransferase